MTDTKYTYSKATDFGGSILLSNLFDEIEASSITTQINKTLTVVNGDTVDIWFKAALSAGEKTTLDNDASPAGGLIAAHDSAPPNPPNLVDLNNAQIDADGTLVTSVIPPSGSETIKISHNFCDKTTWYTDSARVTGGSCTEVSGTVFDMPDSNIIDMTHGKVYDENGRVAEVGHGYAVKVYVDGVEKTEDEPFGGTTHDYSLNYTTGRITFAVSQTGKTVTADYSKAQGSKYCVIPDAGKKVQIERAEVQFSSDFDMKDTFRFRVVTDIGGGTYIDVVPSQDYKTLLNIIQEAYGTFPEMKAMGGSTRGIGVTYYNFPFHYSRRRDITSTPALEVWVELENDQVCLGEHASVTFHCSVGNN